MLIEPFQFNQTVDIVVAHSRHSALANAAWDSLYCGDPAVYSLDFEAGFKDGFVDFLDFGGCGEPPAVPPRKYWKNRYQTPQGYQAVEDWFAGFRQGVVEAKRSGFRQFATVPTPETSSHTVPFEAGDPVPTPATLPTAPNVLAPSEEIETLPAPQQPPESPPGPAAEIAVPHSPDSQAAATSASTVLASFSQPWDPPAQSKLHASTPAHEQTLLPANPLRASP